jgi:hypothetical protein
MKPSTRSIADDDAELITILFQGIADGPLREPHRLVESVTVHVDRERSRRRIVSFETICQPSLHKGITRNAPFQYFLAAFW